MKFVPEHTIDEAAARLGLLINEEKDQALVEEFSEEQPFLLTFLTGEHVDILTEGEKEYLFFLTLVIWLSIKNTSEEELLQVTPETLEEWEEKNWEMLQQSQAKKFYERIDPFFLNYPQTDLLAFAEDALVPDEDNVVTKTGREPMFVMLKSIVDSFLNKV